MNSGKLSPEPLSPKSFRPDQHGLKTWPNFLYGQKAWEMCFQYLNDIEDSVSLSLRRRTLPEWLHLYRRIGVSLDPRLGGQIDPVTTGLVRETAELMMSKYSAIREYTDLILSKNIKARDILGGLFLKEARNRLGNHKSTLQEAQSVIDSNQLVLKKFSEEDVIDLYFIESMAYEYWRTSAVMRAIGKGVGVRPDKEGFIEYRCSPELSFLIEHYDKSVEKIPFSSSLVGAWFPTDVSDANDLSVMAASYNIYSSKFGEACRMFDVQTNGPILNFSPNFRLAPINVSKFHQANEFLESSFERIHGFKLIYCAYCLCFLTNYATQSYSSLPSSMKHEGISSDPNKLFKIINLSQRAYSVYFGSVLDLKEYVYNSLKMHFGEIDQKGIDDCIEHMCINHRERDQIKIWGRGRKFPLIPFKHGVVINLEAVAGFLNNLLTEAKDTKNEKGYFFENTWREALRRSGFETPIVGEIISHDDTMREVDSSVRIGSTLYLIECKATERPLDYEIGSPRTLDNRRKDLTKKVNQAKSLKEFLLSNPHGKNYDIRWAKELKYFVISPLQEFLWSKGGKYWDGEQALILSATSMKKLLEYHRKTIC